MNATEHEKVSKARADLDAAEDYINSLDLAPNLVHRLRSGIAALDELLAQPVEPSWFLDDNKLRFVQRVLESAAPAADKEEARRMVVEMRTSLRAQPPKQGEAA